ncbi:YgcG family protein [Bradyrhizobium sp. WD16]|uniref:TPM domain-containing protein n=1 Tax=Bradyrhizobium sp. WD16 TaxID=1521768 RepID=UPI0020A4E37B|nr:TPM domain-containing protein [Bradyrhizobium sp. WD16]UTD26119.1 hypothetical protein DB459_03450 [Bradyrhizobium sp. WD16]
MNAPSQTHARRPLRATTSECGSAAPGPDAHAPSSHRRPPARPGDPVSRAARGTAPRLIQRAREVFSRLLATLLLFFTLFGLAAAAPTFPQLTGRVVDEANIIPAETRDAITQKLADLEAKSGIQLVVATVSSLQGEEIEPYANALFRSWQLGEKARNNGVLLLVAPNERRVRIEVGYGLEGTLTDALSKVIIANAMTPRFKAGQFGDGIARGVDDIITVLTTDSSEWQQKPDLRLDSSPADPAVSWVLIAALIALVTLLIISPGFRWFFFNVVLNILFSAASGSRSSGGSSGGGGFSGGGGSSGGGGASGSW